MIIRIPLKNNEDAQALVDVHVFEALSKDEHLQSVNFLNNLRVHSHGYAFFQKFRSKNHKPKYETIYLHKYIAERFVPKPEADTKLFIRFIDGNALNAQLENLEWVTMSQLKRHMKGTKSAHGFRGVTLDRGRFRAVLYYENKKVDLGFYKTAQEAAEAYNKKSIELFGETNSLNDV